MYQNWLKSGILDYDDDEIIKMNIYNISPRSSTPQVSKPTPQDDTQFSLSTTFTEFEEELSQKLKKEGLSFEEVLTEYSKILVSLSTLSDHQLRRKQKILEKYKIIIELSTQINMAKVYQIIEDIEFTEDVSVETIEIEIKCINEDLQDAINQNVSNCLNTKLKNLQYALEFQKQILRNQETISEQLNQKQLCNPQSSIKPNPQPSIFSSDNDMSQILNEFNILLTKDLHKYMDAIAKDNSLKTQQQYQNLQEQVKEHEENEDFQAINEILVANCNNVDFSKHCAIKTYLEYILIYPGKIENPLLFEQVRNKLVILEPPEKCKKHHNQLIANTKKGSINNIRNNYENLKNLNQGDYITKLNIILGEFINFALIPQPNNAENKNNEQQKEIFASSQEKQQILPSVELEKEPDKNYQFINFDQTEKIYLEAQNHKKLDILTYLHINQPLIYLQIVELDQYLQTLIEYKNIEEQLLSLSKAKEYNIMSQKMTKIYNQSQLGLHCAVKFHIEFTKQNPLLIESPIILASIQQELTQIQVPEDCKLDHQLIMKNAAKCSFEKIFIIFKKIKQKYYQEAISLVLRKLSKFKIVLEQIKQTEEIFEAIDKLSKKFNFFENYNDLEIAIFEKSSVVDAIGFFNKLIIQSNEQEQTVQILGYVIQLHQLIDKVFQNFSNLITLQFILISFAPDKIKANVQDLFKRLEQQFHQMKITENQENKIKIKQCLEDILYEDPDFTNHLLYYLQQIDTNTWLEKEYKQIDNLNTKRNTTLDKIRKSLIYENSNLQQIPDFLAIIVDTDIEQLQKQISEEYRHSGTIQGHKLQIVLYDLIKKRCTFDKFLTQLSPNSKTDKEMLYTQLSLQMFLLDNADTFLKTLLLIACSSFMPLPLIAYQQIFSNMPVQIDEEMKYHEKLIESQDNTMNHMKVRPMIYEELFFAFEKFKSVLNFKLSANENKSPQGCTSMVNFIFQKRFETHTKTTANHGSIEIQFDYNFEKPMFIPAADAHGLVDHKILEQVYMMFDIFMIHIYKSDQNQFVLDNQIKIIRNKVEKSVIITIEYEDDDNQESDFTTEIDKNNPLNIKVKMCSFNRLNQLQQNQLKIFILEEYMKVVKGFITYQENIQSRIQSLEMHSNFIKIFITMINTEFLPQQLKLDKTQIEVAIELNLKGSNKIKEAHSIIKEFMQQIVQYEDQLHSEKVLTMNFFYRITSLLEKKLVHDSEITQEQCDSTRAEISKLTSRIKNAKPSFMTEQLQKIMNHQNYLGIASIISKFLKEYLNAKLGPLRQRRADISLKSKEINIKQEKQDLINLELQQLSDIIDQKWYSNEFLYREFYIHEKFQIKDSNEKGIVPYENYLSLVNLQIQQGQPFEIIDGNNLQFVDDVYHRIQIDNSQNDNILVISVIGPQSSGKSLLLNTLFGAQFLSAAGRCTRGIYGCIIDVKALIGGTRYSKILLLDSEGIQSTEVKDKKFDSRIVFYILCVSHIVLICSKSEINNPLQELIKIATDAISQLREQISKQPQVNIIMNMVPTIDEHSLTETIQNLTMAILEINQQKNYQQLFTIDRNNVFMLPHAFAQSGCDGMIVNQPSFYFAQRVEQLRKKIIDFLINKDLEESTQFSIDSWFKFAAKFWKFTDEFKGITDYSTLDERRQDMMLSSHINHMIETKFQDQNNCKKYEDKIKEYAQIVLEEHKGFNQTNVTELKYKIDQKVLPFKKEVEEEFEEEFTMFCEEKGVDQLLKKKRQAQLDKQVTQHICGWDQIVNKLISEFMNLKSRFIGDQSFQKAIQILIKNNSKTYTEKEANTLFEKEQKLVEQNIKKQLKTMVQIIQETSQIVGNMYKANVSIKGGNKEKESQCLKFYLEGGHKYIQQALKEQKYFFYYSGKNIRPDPLQIINSYKKEKQLLQIEILFSQMNQQEVYNWEQVVNERFNFSILQKNLQEITTNTHKKYYILNEQRRITDPDQLTMLINQINKEGKHFGVALSQDIENQILSIEEYFRDCIKKQFNQDLIEMNTNEQISFISTEAIPIFVKYMIKSISQCFKYTQTTKYPLIPSVYFNYYAKRIQQSYNNQLFSMHYYVNQIQNPLIDFVPPLGQHGLKKAEIMLVVHKNIRDNVKNKNLTQYLEYLAKPETNYLKRDDTISNDAQQYFYQSMNHTKIIQMIQHIVLENLSRTQNIYDQNETIENVLADLRKSKDISVIQKYCTLDYRVIQQTVLGIEEIMKIIDEELKPYCFQISESGILFLHLLAMTYISSIMIELKRISDRGPLFTLRKNIDIQRLLFVAKLTSNDIQMDTNQAKEVAISLANCIHQELELKTLENFQSVILQEKQIFQLKTIVSDIENYLIQLADSQQQIKPQEKQNINKYIHFYLNPTKYLKSEFQILWDNIAINEIKRQKQIFEKQRVEILQDLKQYFKKLHNLIEEKRITLATEAFIPKAQGKSPQTIQFKRICQKACTEYFLQLLKKQWIQGKEFIIDGEVVSVNPIQILVYQEDIGLELMPKQIQNISNDLQDKTISNLSNFIFEFIKCLDQELTKVNILIDDKIIGDQYKILMSKTLGCNQYCPLCHRQCDQDHQEAAEDRIHKCESGHQIQGFGGIRHQNGEANTVGCHDLVDEDEIQQDQKNDQWEKWSAYKSRKKMSPDNWYLDEIQKGSNKLHREKSVKIWNLIGDQICLHYSSNDVPIKYLSADLNSSNQKKMPQKILYILILDQSGSMADLDKNCLQRWQNLLEAVGSFLQQLETNLIQKMNSRVSIITYTQDFKLVCDNQIPSINLSLGLGQPTGGTDFNPPLGCAKSLMDKHMDSFDHFTVCLMSDGQAEYPKSAAQSIKNSSKIMSKIDFQSIAYGIDQDSISKTLKPLADELGGKFVQAIEAKDLVQSFMKLIPNLYGVNLKE